MAFLGSMFVALRILHGRFEASTLGATAAPELVC